MDWMAFGVGRLIGCAACIAVILTVLLKWIAEKTIKARAARAAKAPQKAVLAVYNPREFRGRREPR